MQSSIYKRILLILANALMVAGILIGYHQAYDIILSFINTVSLTATDVTELVKRTAYTILSQEKPILFGGIFSASVISYDIILLWRWITSFRFTREKVCKDCSQKMIREQRQPIDRFISNFVTVKRYRCIGCGQEYLIADKLEKHDTELASEKVLR